MRTHSNLWWCVACITVCALSSPAAPPLPDPWEACRQVTITKIGPSTCKLTYERGSTRSVITVVVTCTPNPQPEVWSPYLKLKSVKISEGSQSVLVTSSDIGPNHNEQFWPDTARLYSPAPGYYSLELSHGTPGGALFTLFLIRDFRIARIHDELLRTP